MPTCAIYARLSQADEASTSTKRQEAESRAYAERLGWEVVSVFVDEGISGYRSVRRPAFEEAVEGLERGDFEALVVWKLDRLTRQGMGAIGMLLDRLEGTGRRIVSVMDGVDTSTSQGRIMVALLSEMARSESKNTSVRIKSAFEEARRKGKWLNGLPPWGYRVTEGRLEPIPELLPECRTVVEAALDGQSLRAIVKDLNARGVATRDGATWTATGISNWLRSASLCGLLPEGRRTRSAYRDPITGETISVGEGIATEAEWRAVQAAIGRRGGWTTTGTYLGTSPLSGLVKCSLCGGQMGSGVSYRCKAAHLGGPGTCTGQTVSRARLEEYVEGRIVSRLIAMDLDDPLLLEVATAWRGRAPTMALEDRRALESALEDAQARLERLEEDHYLKGAFEGRLDVFERLRERTLGELQPIRAELARLPRIDPEDLLADFQEPETIREGWAGASVADRQAVARVLIEAVIVKPPSRRGATFDGGTRIEVSWGRVL